MADLVPVRTEGRTMSTSPSAAHIAAQIRRSRKSRGWSIDRLAEEAGVAPNTVSRVERGEKVRPGNLYAIRTTLGLPDGNGEQESTDDARGAAIELALDLTNKWLRALPEDEVDAAIQELTRWIVTRM